MKWKEAAEFWMKLKYGQDARIADDFAARVQAVANKAIFLEQQLRESENQRQQAEEIAQQALQEASEKEQLLQQLYQKLDEYQQTISNIYERLNELIGSEQAGE